ncbi:MAG: hypothetical protein V4735_03505 [Pseudomonadota bacterium]
MHDAQRAYFSAAFTAALRKELSQYGVSQENLSRVKVSIDGTQAEVRSYGRDNRPDTQRFSADSLCGLIGQMNAALFPSAGISFHAGKARVTTLEAAMKPSDGARSGGFLLG